MTAHRTSLFALFALVATAFPLALGAAPAAAVPGSAPGRLDFDRSGSATDDYDLAYTVQVSNTTPAAGDDVTVTLAWDEVDAVGPFGYTNVNICWDAPAGWAGAGPAPTVGDYEIVTPADTAANGQVVGTDVPGVPGATADFTSTAATAEAAVITSYDTPGGLVYRFCAHADAIDARESGLVDSPDDIAGTMTVTLEAPGSGAASFRGLVGGIMSPVEASEDRYYAYVIAQGRNAGPWFRTPR